MNVQEQVRQAARREEAAREQHRTEHGRDETTAERCDRWERERRQASRQRGNWRTDRRGTRAQD